jgi:hypothetical protein
MRRRCPVSRRSATRGSGHVAWSGPFRRRSFLEFPSRERSRLRGRPYVTRVTVSLSTPFARRRSWGSVAPFAGLVPHSGGRCISARPDPRAVRRRTRHGGFAVRPAGPVERLGAVSFPVALNAVQAPARNGGEGQRSGRPMGRSIEDGSVRLLGLCSGSSRLRSAPPAFVFSGGCRPALGFDLSQV